MKNWMIPMPQGGNRPSTSSTDRRKKLPQAKSAVANRTSHGTRRANTDGGVASRMSAPIAPPTRLIRTSVLIVRPGGVSASARPVKPVTSWAGNSATVEVMLAARGSMPVSISDGRVMNEPPPASAFCVPAHIAAMKRTTRAVICNAPLPQLGWGRWRGEGAPPSGEIPRRSLVLGDQRIKVDPDRRAVDNPPFARDHHPIGAVRAAENQRGKWIVRAREARLVELEQGEVGLIADLDPADVGASEAARRAFSRPAQDVAMGDLVGAVAKAADHQRVANRLHHIGGIIGSRAVDAEADR